jgi:hypothetical protein
MPYITWRDIKSFKQFVDLQEAVRSDRNILANADKRRDILKALDDWEVRYHAENKDTGTATRKDVFDHGRELFPQGRGGGASNVNAVEDKKERGVSDTDIESEFLKD